MASSPYKTALMTTTPLLRQLLASAAMLSCAAHAGATTASGPVCNDLSSLSGAGVTVRECVTTYSSSTHEGTYNLTNNSGKTIDEFWVSTQASSVNDKRNRTFLANWNSEYVTEAAWNLTAVSALLGNFDSVFGTADTGVFHYWMTSGASTQILSNNIATGEQFRFGAAPSSNFLVVNHNGGTTNFVAASVGGVGPSTTPVPEPASLALVALSLAGLGLARRR